MDPVLVSLLVLTFSPTPTIKWFKKGGELPEQKVRFENHNKTLKIASVSEEDAGEYVCMANNHLGSIRHSIFVQVKGEWHKCLLIHVCLCYHAEPAISSSHSGSVLAGQTLQPGAGPRWEWAPGVPGQWESQTQHPVASQRTTDRKYALFLLCSDVTTLIHVWIPLWTAYGWL